MASSRVGSALARLGGADIAISESQSGERDSAVAMGLVVVSTAVLAAISVAFALFDLLRWSAWVAVPMGLVCGAVILNIDRLYVVSMRPGRNTWATVGSVLPRIAIAALLGIVIAIPLMLRIFDAEVQSQMAVDRAHMTRVLSGLREQDPQRVELDDLTNKIDHYESVLAGDVQSSTPLLEQARADLQTARDKLTAKQAAYDEAYCSLSRELSGQSCGMGEAPDIGILQSQLTAALDSASAALEQARGDVALKEAALRQAQDASKVTSDRQLGADQQEADRVLPALRQQRDTIQSNLTARSSSDADALASVGVLPQIQALVHLGDQSVVARVALSLVAALIVGIQLLPVVVKSILLLQHRNVDALDSSRKVNT